MSKQPSDKPDTDGELEGFLSDQENQPKGPWVTPIIRKENGEPIGASIFLDKEDLEELAIELENQSRIYYVVQNGGIRIADNAVDNA